MNLVWTLAQALNRHYEPIFAMNLLWIEPWTGAWTSRAKSIWLCCWFIQIVIRDSGKFKEKFIRTILSSYAGSPNNLKRGVLIVFKVIVILTSISRKLNTISVAAAPSWSGSLLARLIKSKILASRTFHLSRWHVLTVHHRGEKTQCTQIPIFLLAASVASDVTLRADPTSTMDLLCAEGTESEDEKRQERNSTSKENAHTVLDV